MKTGEGRKEGPEFFLSIIFLLPARRDFRHGQTARKMVISLFARDGLTPKHHFSERGHCPRQGGNWGRPCNQRGHYPCSIFLSLLHRRLRPCSPPSS
jgi:hypothetical protein